MRLKWLLLPVACVAMLGVVGCSEKHQTQKQAATQQWNSARANVLFGLAKDQYATGNFDQCRKTLSDALHMDPDNAKARVLSAKLAIEQGQLELAQQELDKSRKIDPKLVIRFKLDHILDAYETFAHAASTRALKVIIEP